jgi:hypothetical protein
MIASGPNSGRQRREPTSPSNRLPVEFGFLEDTNRISGRKGKGKYTAVDI